MFSTLYSGIFITMLCDCVGNYIITAPLPHNDELSVS